MSGTDISSIQELADIVNGNGQKEAEYSRQFSLQDFHSCLIRRNDDPNSAQSPMESGQQTPPVSAMSVLPLDVLTTAQNLTDSSAVPHSMLCQQNEQRTTGYQQPAQVNESSTVNCYSDNTDRSTQIGQTLMTTEHQQLLNQPGAIQSLSEQLSGYAGSNMNNMVDTSNILQALIHNLQLSCTNQSTIGGDENQIPRSCISPLVQLTNQLDHLIEGPKQSCSFANPDVNSSLNFSCRLAVPGPMVLQSNSPCQDNSANSAAMMTFANLSSVIDMLVKNHGDENYDKNSQMSNIGGLSAAGEQNDDGKDTIAPGKFCAECNLLYKEHCAHHNTKYSHDKDTEVLSRARLSVPSCLLLQESFVEPNCTGVWTRTKVSQHTKFGPLIGRRSEPDSGDEVVHEKKNKTKPWKIFMLDKFLKLDSSNENECNWMMFIQPARTGLEQNVIMYQEDEDIFAVTASDIEQNQELLFWYCKDYAVQLGVSVKPIAVGGAAQCHICAQHFPDKKTMMNHRKKMHPEILKKKLSCTECDKKFPTLSKLDKHYYSHTGIKPLKCTHCSKQFSEQGNLNKHLLIHLGVKKFSCNICHQKYRQRAHLESHMLCHTGEKELQCSHCDRRFARKSDLRHHEFSHTKERVFACTYCPGLFHRKQNWERHMAIHTENKNHRCEICSKAFLRKYHLLRHVVVCEKKNAQKPNIT